MSPKQQVLAAFGGIPDLVDLIPAGFRNRFELSEPSQYGIVCQDVRAGIERLEAMEAVGY